MKQGLRAIRLSSMGGPNSITNRLLNYLGYRLPNLFLGSMTKNHYIIIKSCFTAIKSIISHTLTALWGHKSQYPACNPSICKR